MSDFQKNIFFLLFTLLIPCHILAQTLSVNPSNTEVGIQQSFELSYALEGAGLRDFQAPSLSDFRIVGGPNQSQSIQFVNGSVSRSVTLSYYLQPKRIGTFTIPPATATTDNGKTLRSGKTVVRVVQGNAAQPQAQRPSSPFGNMPPMGFPPGMPQPQQQAPAAPQVSATPRVWVKAVIDQPKVYQGQQLTVTYKIFTNTDVLSYNLDNAASFTGFWVEEMNTPQNRQNVTINGENYTTVDLKKYALFPQRSGILTIDQIGGKADIRVADPNGGFFGMFGQTQEVNLKSDTAVVQVMPLPQPQPADFTGGVGSFSAQVQTDKNTLAANESFKLQLRVAGEGNTKLISNPTVEFPASFEHFDPQVTETVSNAGDAIVGNKIFEYTIVPTETGNFEIPSIKFSYFDPKEQQYKSIEQPAISLQITPSAVTNTNDNRQLSEPDTHLSLHSPTKPLLQYAIYWLVWALPLAFFAFGWIKAKLNPRVAPDPILLRQQQAAATALAQIDKAQIALAANNSRLFYEQIQHALRQYVSDKFGLSVGWAKDTATPKMQAANVSDQNIEKLVELLTHCENNAYLPTFAPTVSDQINVQVMQWIKDVENDTKAASATPQKMPKVAIWGVLLLFAIALFAADNSDKMQQALDLYNKNEYAQAAVIYENLLKTDQQSAALYYNLGNCYYKLKQTAPAVLNYERALLLSPSNAHIQHNLLLANQQVLQKADTLPRLFIVQVWLRFCQLLSSNIWAILAVLFVWLWAILVKKNTFLSTPKRLYKALHICLLLASFCSLGASYTLYKNTYLTQFAIVNKPLGSIRELPSETSALVVELSAGAKLNLLNSQADWWQVELSSGQKGWIEGKDLWRIN